MSQYKPYPDSKTTPSRKTRKSDRNRIFQHNRTIHKKVKKERQGD
jgi:hypothetical protein